MFLHTSRSIGFRNLKPTLCHWHEGLNLLLGPNGAGKTNTLEVMHLISGWGSFQNQPPAALLAPEASSVVVAGRVKGEEEREVQLTLWPRTDLKIDGHKATWTSLRQNCPTLPFLPQDMQLIEGGPQVRRHFMDLLLTLLDPLHARRLAELRKLCRMKKLFLAHHKPTSAIDRALTPVSVALWRSREALVAELERLFLSEGFCPLSLSLSLKRGGGGAAIDPYEDYQAAFARLGPKEREAKTLLFGPQRDDLEIKIGPLLARDRLSRGQRRRAALSLVLAAAHLVQSATGKKPLLLVDELASELDSEGKDWVTAALVQSGCQVFAATAEWNRPWPGAVYTVDQGKVQEVKG